MENNSTPNINLEKQVSTPNSGSNSGVTLQRYPLSTTGKGGEYFSIILINYLLCLVTLGLYYPWAKEKRLKYLYSNIQLEKDEFQFHGTGKEMFKGFLRFLLIMLGVVILVNLCFFALKSPFLGMLIYLAAILILTPMAIHGSLKYRASKSTWRGIRFGYRGDLKTFRKIFLYEYFLTIITGGIYGSWAETKVKTYLFNNMKFGSLKGSFVADGTRLFFIRFKGALLTFITIGIYSAWMKKELIDFNLDHLEFNNEKNEKIRFKFHGEGVDLLMLNITNALLIVFTLGIGYAWAQIRIYEFIVQHMGIYGNTNLSELSQTELEYNNAMGDDMLDAADFDIAL